MVSETQAAVARALISQLTMISVPLLLVILIKGIAYLTRKYYPNSRLSQSLNPDKNSADTKAEEIKKEKPKLTTGPQLERHGQENNGENLNFRLQVKVRENEERGTNFKHSWLKSYHSFNFGSYKHEDYIGFGSIRVLNEDFIEPSKGYPQLVRQNYEIITLVISGSLNHLDSLDNECILRTNSLSAMTCGSGITHLETNSSQSTELHYLQLWLAPNASDLKPNFRRFDYSSKMKRNKFVAIASPYNGVDKIKVQTVTAEDLKRQPKDAAPQPSINSINEVSETDELDPYETKLKNTLGLQSDTFIFQCDLEPDTIVPLVPQPGVKRKLYIHVPTVESKGKLFLNYQYPIRPGDGAFLNHMTEFETAEIKNIGTELLSFYLIDMA